MTCVTHIPEAAGAQPDFHARRALAALKAPHGWRFGQAAGGDGKAGRGGQGHGGSHGDWSRRLPYAHKGDLISPDLGE